MQLVSSFWPGSTLPSRKGTCQCDSFVTLIKIEQDKLILQLFLLVEAHGGMGISCSVWSPYYSSFILKGLYLEGKRLSAALIVPGRRRAIVALVNVGEFPNIR